VAMVAYSRDEEEACSPGRPTAERMCACPCVAHGKEEAHLPVCGPWRRGGMLDRRQSGSEEGESGRRY